ncbi:phage holin family protein [Kineococcus rhizosphaerae]|uniref:Putative superfamily III holin-X n=1 Tax=Kineococcus rhizosphaerae TaxID=559628 RepID=A0A2T0QYN5_9ACTN|nr:phage holin family protein [Kineococcus rhizosphaerae]PRY11487.1 putative superfamily III holin-X [Kineococcus rhizosphaerae]
MTQPTGSGTRTDDLSVTHGPGPTAGPTRSDESVGQLLSQLTEQVSHLVRDEVQLAKIDLTEKGKKAGVGIGMFSGAGLLAFFGVGALVTTAIIGLSHAVTAWLAALIVAVVLFAIAAVLALMGKKEVQQATPVVPKDAVEGLKQDVQTVKEGFHR